MHSMMVVDNVYIIAFIASILGTADDIPLTWTSPVLPKLHSNDSSVNPFGAPITPVEDSWIGSLENFGSMIGPFLYGIIGTFFGRKTTLLSSAVLHAISYLTLAIGKNVYYYYFARFVSGVAMGGSYAFLPTYISEIAKDNQRGKLFNLLNFCWTFGCLVPYAIGPYLSIFWFNIILACVPLTFFVLFLTFAPETPYYLLKKRKYEEAEKCLKLLRSKTNVSEDVKHIEGVLEHDRDGKSCGLFKSKALLRALGISVFLVFSKPFCGMIVFLAYTQSIFDETISIIPSRLSALIVGLMYFCSSLVSICFIDRIGRRLLLLVSAIGMAIPCILLGVYFYLRESGQDVDKLSWIPVFCLSIYILMANIGFGPVTWTLISEIFPLSAKTVAAPFISVSVSLGSFLTMRFFNISKEVLKTSGTMWFFGVYTLFTFVCIYFFVPETKGKSFKEIQEILENPKSVNTVL